MADICLVSITKVRGGLLWLLSAWSMSLKSAEGHFVTLSLVNGTKGRGSILTKLRRGLLWLLTARSVSLKCAEVSCGLLPAWSMALKGAEHY